MIEAHYNLRDALVIRSYTQYDRSHLEIIPASNEMSRSRKNDGIHETNGTKCGSPLNFCGAELTSDLIKSGVVTA